MEIQIFEFQKGSKIAKNGDFWPFLGQKIVILAQKLVKMIILSQLKLTRLGYFENGSFLGTFIFRGQLILRAKNSKNEEFTSFYGAG